MTNPFKPGDLLAAKSNPEMVLVVEQCFNRGLVQHVLCSFRDYAYTPVFYISDYLEKVND